MKKILVIATAAAFLFSCASAGRVETAAAPEAAQKTEILAAAPAPVQKEPVLITVRIPVETKSKQYFADATLDEYTLSEYSSSDDLLAQSRYSASGSVVERTEYSYKDGELISKKIIDGEGKLQSRKTYSYGPRGHILLEVLEDGAGKTISSFEYSYDEQGHRSAWIVKDSKGVPIAETLYSYKDGRIRSAELRDGSGKKTGSSAYEYDAEGFLSVQRYFDASGSTLRIESTTWKDAKIVLEERSTAGGFVQQRSTYEYGKDGELLKKTMEDLVGKNKRIFEYEYRFREEQRRIEG
ncbi:hypothetical protein MASR2M78_07360 [Treponema sp.]